MSGLLLDTVAFVRYVAGGNIETNALIAIAKAQEAGTLFVSPVVAWEAAVAVQKRNPENRPDLRDLEPALWFKLGRRLTGAKLTPFGQKIALEAARVPAIYGRGDPGDCFMIATARV